VADRTLCRFLRPYEGSDHIGENLKYQNFMPPMHGSGGLGALPKNRLGSLTTTITQVTETVEND